MLDKRGFLFTVTVFLILTYILLSISVWVKSIETSEKSFSEFYKESTVELTIDQITPTKMDNMTYIIMNRALQRLDEASIDYPLKNGTLNDQNQHIRSAMFSLLVNGSSDPSDFVGGSSNMPIASTENSSLTAWANNLNSSLRAIGIYMDQFSVSNFQIGQSDINLVNYSFDISLGLRDYTNISSVTRTYHISNQLDVSGLVDPALARESQLKEHYSNETIYRMFFFQKNLYYNQSNITISKSGTSPSEGEGFLYGQLALASGSGDHLPYAYDVPPDERANYILVGSFGDILNLTPLTYNEFAGFIVTSSPTTTPSCNGNVDEGATFNPIHYTTPKCVPSINDGLGYDTDKPFMVANFNPTDAPLCPTLDNSTTLRRCVLFTNTYSAPEVQATPLDKLDTSKSGIYSVEKIRDFVMCGYYDQDPLGPSYLQRLFDDSYSYNDSVYGIDTFVIGNYANDYGVYDTSSRLDRELFNGMKGTKVLGLPGCKNYYTCSDEPITGIFAVSDSTATAYDLSALTCENNAEECQ